jgi:dTDP-4-amino-4,6-dideoxygalactose transaminase
VIPLIDLKAQYLSIRPEIDAAIRNVLENGAFILGAEVEAFEQEFAAYCGAKFGIGVNSGTSALHLALLAAGVGEGDEVITTPFTFVATAAAIRYAGARPVFVDIEPDSFNLDPARIEEAVTAKTKAILPVHLFGQPADMDPILEIARRRRLLVIEDAAQAHGAEYQDRRAGSLAHLACFSFYPTKNLGACGEGGMVVTDNPEFDRSIRLLRDWGSEKRYHYTLHGFNYRLEGLQGAILRVKLRRLDEWTEARRANACRYGDLLRGSGIRLPRPLPRTTRHVYNNYTIRTSRRDRLQQCLLERGVQTGIYYPVPLHLQEAYRYLGHAAGDFPESEKAAVDVLSIPVSAGLTAEQVETVAAEILQFSR